MHSPFSQRRWTKAKMSESGLWISLRRNHLECGLSLSTPTYKYRVIINKLKHTFWFWGTISHVAQADLDLAVYLRMILTLHWHTLRSIRNPDTPEYWDYRDPPSYPPQRHLSAMQYLLKGHFTKYLNNKERDIKKSFVELYKIHCCEETLWPRQFKEGRCYWGL